AGQRWSALVERWGAPRWARWAAQLRTPRGEQES
ncbi:hypothetical protein GA0115260_127211, partial [Streptomyces sp. MnatMP-M27]